MPLPLYWIAGATVAVTAVATASGIATIAKSDNPTNARDDCVDQEIRKQKIKLEVWWVKKRLASLAERHSTTGRCVSKVSWPKITAARSADASKALEMFLPKADLTDMEKEIEKINFRISELEKLGEKIRVKESIIDQRDGKSKLLYS